MKSKRVFFDKEPAKENEQKKDFGEEPEKPVEGWLVKKCADLSGKAGLFCVRIRLNLDIGILCSITAATLCLLNHTTTDIKETRKVDVKWFFLAFVCMCAGACVRAS